MANANNRFEGIRVAIARLLNAGHRPCHIVRDLEVSKTTVMKVKRQMKTGEGVDTKPRCGRPRSVRTPATIKTAKKLIAKAPRTTIAKVSRKLKISRRSGERLIKQDLSSSSRKIRDVPSVGNSVARRIERTRGLLNFVKNSEHCQKVRIFSDEKLFVVDQVVNRQNDRYITDLPIKLVDPGIKFNSVSKHPAKVMVLGILASDGRRCPLIFIHENEKITSEVYQKLLRRHFLPWLRKNYASGTYVFQQDGAPAHTSRSTVDFLNAEAVEFWTPSMWPPSSPDLNPLDYAIWSRMVKEVNNHRHTSVVALKKAIKKSWNGMDEAYIKNVVGSFRSRLERVLEGDGAYVH